jgi:hypothetical protein
MPFSKNQGEWLGLLVLNKNVIWLVFAGRAEAKISCSKLLTYSKELVRLLRILFERLLTFRSLIRFWGSTKAPLRVRQHRPSALPFAPCPPPPQPMLDHNLNPSVRSHLSPRAGTWPHRTHLSQRGLGLQATHFSIRPPSHALTRLLPDLFLSHYLPPSRTQ